MSFESLSLVLALALAGLAAAQEPASVKSPGGRIEWSATGGKQLTWRVSYDGKPLIAPSALGLDLEGQAPLGPGMSIASSQPSSGEDVYRLPHGKTAEVRARYNALTLNLAEGGRRPRQLVIEARVFDDAVAFRYLVPSQVAIREARIARELTQFTLAKESTIYPLLLRGYRTSYEDSYHKLPVSSMHPEWLAALPLLAEVPGVAWTAITEAHIENYAGMYLSRGSGARTLEARLAPNASEPQIAVSMQTPMRSPWRVVMIAGEPGRLIESNVVTTLNPPSQIADTSWIRPGKVAWPWWSGEVAKVANPGMNTATNKYYIDFAAESGLDYVLIDEGWSHGGRGPDGDLTRSVAEVDMAEILRYAGQKGVKIWLWAHWTLVDRQMEETFSTFAKWGVVGVKIDFMDRDDQWMVDYYHRVLKSAAAHKLMVDFHGAYKPDGIRRTWPNLMTREGVLGLEYTKWSGRVDPDHNVMLPFTRMLAGPLDYTPGGFRNATRADFVPRMKDPLVMGTRAHHLAMFVVYESPFLCLADHPDAYRGQDGFDLIQAVPATWDETRVLDGEPGEYVAIARRRGKDWFAGVMTGWTPREITLPLRFLGSGSYLAEIWSDSPDAAVQPAKVSLEKRKATAGDSLQLKLAPGGGCAIRLRAQ